MYFPISSGRIPPLFRTFPIQKAELEWLYDCQYHDANHQQGWDFVENPKVHMVFLIRIRREKSHITCTHHMVSRSWLKQGQT